MNNSSLAAGILIGLAVFGVQVVSSQSAPKAGTIAVNEAKAHAVLAEDSIRFELPLTAPAVTGKRAVAWLLSPTGKRSGETAIDLRAGVLAASIHLPRPKDEHGQFVKELGWYRIAYRIEAPGALRTEGIVAVGAIATNLMELRLARPASLVAGKPIRIRVYAGNPITRAPFAGVHRKATLDLGGDSTGEDKTTKRTIIREAITDGCDEITLPVNLRNYLTHSLALPVTVKPADWFTLLTPSKVNATVTANGTTPVLFGFHATKAVEAGPLNITATNANEGDAVEKTVRVHPDGEPRSETASGLLRGGSTTLALDLPADTIPGSIHAELLLYPNLGAHILHSMKAVLERPYGCGEQTISSTYPSLLYLELLKTSKGTSPLQDEAQNYLQQGYDRLIGYFSASGGITYWGRGDEAPDAALTAYGIEFLAEAGPYIKVDQSLIEKAVLWLIANQQADGSWKPHYGETSAELNLYVAEALHRTLASKAFAQGASKDLRERMNKAVVRAIGWSATSAAAVHDPYANALRLHMADNTESTEKLRAELSAIAQHDRNGAHWSNQGSSPFYGWGRAGELETTALVLSALGQSVGMSNDRVLVNDALFYLLRNQDRYGIWYSGQATARVLQALLPIAIEQMKTTGSAQEFRLTVNGAALTGNEAEALRTDPKLLDAPRSLELTALLKPGHNELAFTSASDSSLASAEASASYYIPWTETATPAQTKTQTGKEYGLDFGYSCAADNTTVGQPIDCTVSARRFGSSGFGMLIAEVGLPPGADVDRASLAKLLDTWTISRYELQPDRIILYLWSWRAEGEQFSFRFTPRYAIHAKAAPATLSDYYNPDLKAVLAPQAFEVKESPRR